MERQVSGGGATAIIAWRYLLVLGLGVLASSWTSVFAFEGVTFDLLLILALYPTLAGGFREGYLHAWLAGLAVDATSLGTGVPHCLSFLAAAYVVALLRGVFEMRDHPLAQSLVIGLVAVACGNVDAIAVRMAGGGHATALLLLSLLTALYTALVAPLLFAALSLLPLARRRSVAELLPLGATEMRGQTT